MVDGGVMKCACKSETCKSQILFDHSSQTMLVKGKEDSEILIYLDANSTVELIKELRGFLDSLASKRQSD